MQGKKIRFRVLMGLLLFVGILVIAFGLLLAFLTISEYRPKELQELTPWSQQKTPEKKIGLGENLRLLSWNIGYAALSSEADFFMDGGKMVYGTSAEKVRENLSSIAAEIEGFDADFVLLQEVDRKSSRSYKINELDFFAQRFPGYNSFFASNYKVSFVPYPLPPLATMDAGLFSLVKGQPTLATRIGLPVPFAWPVRLINLKRCLLMTRYPIEGNPKELVVINVHLEAYDDGEGRMAQANQLKTLIEKEVSAGNYVIAAGDFNQAFSSVNLDAFPVYEGRWQAAKLEEGDFSSDLQFLMRSDVPTCRSLDSKYDGADKSKFQYYIIDGMILSSNIKVETFTVVDLDFKNSDHNPLMLDFRLSE